MQNYQIPGMIAHAVGEMNILEKHHVPHHRRCRMQQPTAARSCCWARSRSCWASRCSRSSGTWRACATSCAIYIVILMILQ